MSSIKSVRMTTGTVIVVLAVSIFSFLSLVNAPVILAKEYRILVLPSGGATGIIPATVLANLEKDTGKPIYQLFDGIASSSIGSMIGALLTTPKTPKQNEPIAEEGEIVEHPSKALMTAEEAKNFIKDVFSTYSNAIQIRSQFKQYVGPNVKMKDTLIPLSIMGAQITAWSRELWPSQTHIRMFSSDENGNTSLASVVSASCTVFPLHPRAEQVLVNGEDLIYCIDAGSEVCTHSNMNPFIKFLRDFSQRINTEDDTVSLYFLSNGWVRLHPSWGDLGRFSLPMENGSTVTLDLFNIDVDLDPAIQEWKMTYTGAMLAYWMNENILYNIIGSGIFPLDLLESAATKVVQESRVYSAIVDSLKSQRKN